MERNRYPTDVIPFQHRHLKLDKTDDSHSKHCTKTHAAFTYFGQKLMFELIQSITVYYILKIIQKITKFRNSSMNKTSLPLSDFLLDENLPYLGPVWGGQVEKGFEIGFLYILYHITKGKGIPGNLLIKDLVIQVLYVFPIIF